MATDSAMKRGYETLCMSNSIIFNPIYGAVSSEVANRYGKLIKSSFSMSSKLA